jgi:transcriptional regulator with XRE-family HTH domain
MRKLGEAAGLTVQSVHKYEMAHSPLSVERLIAISKALGVPAGFLIDAAVSRADADLVLRKLREFDRQLDRAWSS